MELRLNWHELKLLQSSPELFSLGLTVEGVYDSIFAISTHEFLVVNKLYPGEERPPTVEKFIWTCDLCYLEAFFMRKMTTGELPKCSPPADVLIEPECRRYEDIIDLVSTGRFGPFSIFQTGLSASIHERTAGISAGRYDFWFTSGVEDWRGEIPVLITLWTSDKRWRSIGG